MSKRSEIVHRISKIKEGILFDCDTFISTEMKRTDITATFCELKKAGKIKSLTRGVFYKPEISSYGFGELPVGKEELIRYFTRKYNAHISGQYGYNLLGLTEQNAQTVTLAGKTAIQGVLCAELLLRLHEIRSGVSDRCERRSFGHIA